MDWSTDRAAAKGAVRRLHMRDGRGIRATLLVAPRARPVAALAVGCVLALRAGEAATSVGVRSGAVVIVVTAGFAAVRHRAGIGHRPGAGTEDPTPAAHTWAARRSAGGITATVAGGRAGAATIGRHAAGARIPPAPARVGARPPGAGACRRPANVNRASADPSSPPPRQGRPSASSAKSAVGPFPSPPYALDNVTTVPESVICRWFSSASVADSRNISRFPAENPNTLLPIRYIPRSGSL